MKQTILIIGLILLGILSSGCVGEKDSDRDGWTDAFEQEQGTDPEDPDTDGDGIIDSKDPEPLGEEKEEVATTAPPLTTTTLSFSETFDSNEHDWPTGSESDEYATNNWRLTNGKYRWGTKAHQGFHWYARPDIPRVSDFKLTVEARQTSGTSDSNYGVVFRRVDHKNFYHFGISNTQKFAFFLKHKGEWTRLINWTKTSAIRPEEVNRLTVIAEGSHFRFFINDIFVAEADNDKLNRGKAGLAIELFDAGDEAVFEFDNFELTTDIPPIETTATLSQTTPRSTSPVPIIYWWNEEVGVHSVDIWGIIESDGVNVKKNGFTGELQVAGAGQKFIIFNVTITKERTTSSGWPLSFILLNEKKKQYEEYALNWRVSQYLDKKIDVGESKTGLLVFRVPEETRAHELHCVGCVKAVEGDPYIAIIPIPPMEG